MARMRAENEAPSDPPTSQQELLRQWDARIADADGDPMAALADLLGARQAARNQLFGMAGQTILGCRLEAILGAGGMGITYDGVDPSGERVAVKLVPGVAEATRPRFEQECRLLAELQHPAIVRYRAHAVLDNGSGVLVMDLVRGCDLERMLLALASNDPGSFGLPAVDALLTGIEERGSALRLSPRYRRRMLRLLADVAAGLHVAHERGVVHRDVKPGNVLVRDDLSPVVIDFGLARDQQNRVSFTQSGMAMGTLAYMAPEQFGDDPGAVDRRADVYAIGLVLYRAMFGIDARKEMDDVLLRRRRAFLLDASQSREAPLDVQAILYRCLDPRPDRRYPTAKELEADLRAAAGQGAVKARIPSWPALALRDRRIVAVLATVCCLALLSFVVVAWPRGRDVMFVANCGLLDAVAVVDGDITAPLGAARWLPYGVYEVELRGDKVMPVRRTIAVTEGPGAQWVTLVTAMPGSNPGTDTLHVPGRSLLVWSSGHQWNPIGVGQQRDRLEIDGQLVHSSVPGMNTNLVPGLHTIEATDGLGRNETQVVDTRNSTVVDVQTLPGVLSNFDGEFRRTWSCIHSPLPSEFSLESDAADWTGLAVSPVVPLDLMAVPCALTPSDQDMDSRVTLRCRFPVAMRSAFVYLRASSSAGGQLRVEVAFDGELPQEVEQDAGGNIARVVALRSQRGAMGLTVSARMRAQTAPTVNVAQVKFLEGMAFGGHWQDQPPCIAVVADPSLEKGERARHKVGSPRLGVPQLELVPVETIEPIGDDPRLAGVRIASQRAPLLSWSATGGETRVVYEAPLPTLQPVRRLAASAMHARLDRDDGHGFGASIVYVADLDDDAKEERVISDPTSGARGAKYAGWIACFGSRDDRVLWSWPDFLPTGQHGDEMASLHFAPVGDWNGDGRLDLVASCARANPATGAHKAGYVAVLDSKTGVELWSTMGEAALETRSISSALHLGDGTRHLLLMRVLDNHDTGRDFSCAWHWVDAARSARVHVGPVVPGPLSAAFVRSARAPLGVALVQAGIRSIEANPGGFERYELTEDGPQLVARLQFEPDFIPIFWSAGLVAIGDVDRDGEEDVLLLARAPVKTVLAARAANQPEPESWCAIVSGRTLGWLGFLALQGQPICYRYSEDTPLFIQDGSGGGDAYLFCSIPLRTLNERQLFRIPIRPLR